EPSLVSAFSNGRGKEVGGVKSMIVPSKVGHVEENALANQRWKIIMVHPDNVRCGARRQHEDHLLAVSRARNERQFDMNITVSAVEKIAETLFGCNLLGISPRQIPNLRTR